jgi:hypothetical protein
MKLISMGAALLLFLAVGCSNNGSDKDKQSNALDEAYILSEDESLNDKLDAKVGDWVEKGKECYGIVIAPMGDGKVLAGSVKAKVMIVKPDRFKMKALEKVSLMDEVGCNQLSIKYGETWWEEEGDLFLSRQEAVDKINEKGWTLKN